MDRHKLEQNLDNIAEEDTACMDCTAGFGKAAENDCWLQSGDLQAWFRDKSAWSGSETVGWRREDLGHWLKSGEMDPSGCPDLRVPQVQDHLEAAAR